MPCRDYEGVDESELRLGEEREEHRKLVAFLEAALCASLTALEKQGLTPALDYLDYKEAGITMAELNVWWREHKQKDAARREWEQRERERKEREAAEKIERQRILATLTPEQRRILGV